jgi:hypothetical protein
MASDQIRDEAPPSRPEARWPVAAAIVVVLCLLIFMPNRVRLLPPSALYVVAVAVLAPMTACAMRPHSPLWPRVERFAVLAFAVVAGVANLAVLRRLILDLVRSSHTLDGLHLLSSSIAIWATNVLMFSLVYWQMDRGGPALRASAAPHRPDWTFPQDQASPDDVSPGWRPGFMDYLFLGYSTATAFSTTDALPLTARAKFAMMTESTVSLVTLVVVAARAINVLGA